MGNFIDLTGNTFDRLVVIERAENAGNEVQWLCRCSCGTIVTIRRGDLTKGKVKSCGCLKKETSRNNGKGCITHGMTRTRLYREWSGMKARCCSPENVNFKNYGARGITVCEEWMQSFEKFREWAVAAGYDDTAPRGQYTLERKDNDGPYSPENCRWATMKDQSMNKRDTIRLTYNGETLTSLEWAQRTGLSAEMIRRRIRRGWSTDRALTEPIHKEKQRS